MGVEKVGEKYGCNIKRGEIRMEVGEVIKRRRSIRHYTKKIPEEKDIRKILEAGIWAPSGLNNQPWKFKVIRDEYIKENLARFTTYSRVIRDAPVAICVFLDKDAIYNREKDIMAVGACIQNMLLEAYELGLGTCWLGEILNRKEEVEKYLGLHSSYELMAVITLGYPAQKQKPTRGKRRDLRSFLLD